MADYYSIDMAAIAKHQHGSNAEAYLAFNHAWGWRARKPHDSTQYGLNLQQYYNDIYGSNWRVIQTGLTSNDWAVHNPYRIECDYTVQPVIIMPAEMAGHQIAVGAAIRRYEANWRFCQGWVREQLGRTFQLLSKTQLVIVPATAQELLDLARSTQMPDQRFEMLYKMRNWTENQHKRTNPNIKYAMALHTGEHPAEDYGSAAIANYLALSSDNTSIAIDPALTEYSHRRAAYDMIHELFHTLGLGHTDSTQGENWRQSIMYQGNPPRAIITDFERQKLMNSPFLKEV